MTEPNLRVGTHDDVYAVYNDRQEKVGTVRLILAAAVLPPVGWVAPVTCEVVTGMPITP